MFPPDADKVNLHKYTTQINPLAFQGRSGDN
jgi:hypothetical protein